MSTPTKSQREAITAERQPLLVVAGPGSGKTFCLIERIRFAIEQHGVAAERILAFTFTNKAAEEIAARLEQLQLAALVKRTTIHKFCVDLLREHGRRVGVEPGFGIADDEYQMQVLWRLEANPARRNALPKYFSLHRLRGDELRREGATRLEQYEAILKKQNVLDFDMLLLKARELLTADLSTDSTADSKAILKAVAGKWDAILVDEFQDLNPVQYDILHALAHEHRNVFAVGDYDQSIYGWAGAQPQLFERYMNDFGITTPIALLENRRTPKHIFDLARRFVETNPLLPGLGGRADLVAIPAKEPFDVEVHSFETADEEVDWIIHDIEKQRARYSLGWGDFALLYRKHEIGNVAEPTLLAAGIPCRLAHGRAISDDLQVRYVAAALRIIAEPWNAIHKEVFMGLVLPKTLRDTVKAEAEANGEAPIDRLRRLANELPRDDENGRKLRRAFAVIGNFRAIAKRHTDVGSLIEELLSSRVGEYKTALEREHLQLSDPATLPDATALAMRIDAAIKQDRPVVVPRLGGAEIPVKAMLHAVGVRTVQVGPSTLEAPEIGLPLAVFKAAQLLASRKFADTFRDYTAIDLETTGNNPDTCHIVEIAAVRVRRGEQVAEKSWLVKPPVPIPADATQVHKITDKDVADAPTFGEVWAQFREFCGSDIIVAHNGYGFDFRVLKRLAGNLQGLGTYDTLPLARDVEPGSRRLEDLARKYNIELGTAHRALPDTRALAKLFLKLADASVAQRRRTAMVQLLDHLGVALALTGAEAEPPESERKLLLVLARPYALSALSDCLEYYRAIREELNDPTLPTMDDVIETLGGEKLMARIRAERGADQRYPEAMMRIRRLLVGCIVEGESLEKQIHRFLERVALSQHEGQAADKDRVNLLTLHSTKGLEFSRVYILGVEDAQFIREDKPSKPELEEARRLLYVGMTRAKDRLVMTRAEMRGGRPTGGTRFLDEMGLRPSPSTPSGSRPQPTDPSQLPEYGRV